MSAKSSPRKKRYLQMEDVRETIAQVHRIIKSDTSSDKDNLSNRSSSIKDNSEDGESNKAFQMEDFNDNLSHSNAPSREKSVEEESQINTKIINLIETEIKKDLNKQSHFSDSRPQSLSFYEDEKMPEELSGNLELLSPEERKHYRRKKEHLADSDERKYNAFQEYAAGDEETRKKSKSRRKKHADPEVGMGDSKEMMIPKEKRKSKKKRRDPTSPQNGRHKKREHKKREEHDVKNDITIALEELQDDVFDNACEEHHKVKKSKENLDPADKLYVQRKNKFEVTSRASNGNMNSRYCGNTGDNRKLYRSPLLLALVIQKCFMVFFSPCHGLLAGLALCHWLFLYTNSDNQTGDFFSYYAPFNDVYITLFYVLVTICFISAFDKVDIAHIKSQHLLDCKASYRYFGAIVVVFYFVALVLHLSIANIEFRIGDISRQNNTTVIANITDDINTWNNVSFWRTVCVFIPWLLLASFLPQNMLFEHLSSMQKYLPNYS